MKKIVLIILSLFFSIYAYSITLTDIKVRLVATIAHVLIKDRVVTVDLKDKNFLDYKKCKEDHIIFVNSCKKADIIITDDVKNIKKSCRNKLIFVTNYRAFENTPFAVGALFWQKGRPVLIFNKRVIDKKHIRLPKQFARYME